MYYNEINIFVYLFCKKKERYLNQLLIYIYVVTIRYDLYIYLIY